MEPGKIPDTDSRIDLSNLKALSGGDGAFEAKYITNFINAMPLQLGRIETALAQRDGSLLYATLHLLKPQLAFYGIKRALDEIVMVENNLDENKEITDLIEKSAHIIFKEVTFACAQFEAIKNNRT